MKVGTAQIEITPDVGIDLAGFAIRPQPSTEILDPLWTRALYLEDGPERLLWLHNDLLALDQALADRWRQHLEAETGVPRSRILISTTHTHSGPATIQLTGCGEVRPSYIEWLETQIRCAANAALCDPEPCRLVNLEGKCNLGVDRRDAEYTHTDPRVAAAAWQRSDGSYKAVVLNYAMHPVCLRGSQISGDWPGEAARVLSHSLPGEPVVIVSSGACGNINPPGVGVSPAQMRQWAREVVQSVQHTLVNAGSGADVSNHSTLRVASTCVGLPLERWNVRDIKRYAAGCLADPAGQREFSDKFRQAVEVWRDTMSQRLERSEPAEVRAELTAMALGQAIFISVNAEAFSRFADLSTPGSSKPVYALNCANGMIGYLPTEEAYLEGAYEVLWSMLFYNMLRPQKGGLELLAQHARQLIAGW
jgi:neutral ceramidase